MGSADLVKLYKVGKYCGLLNWQSSNRLATIFLELSAKVLMSHTLEGIIVLVQDKENTGIYHVD